MRIQLAGEATATRLKSLFVLHLLAGLVHERGTMLDTDEVYCQAGGYRESRKPLTDSRSRHHATAFAWRHAIMDAPPSHVSS